MMQAAGGFGGFDFIPAEPFLPLFDKMLTVTNILPLKIKKIKKDQKNFKNCRSRRGPGDFANAKSPQF